VDVPEATDRGKAHRGQGAIGAEQRPVQIRNEGPDYFWRSAATGGHTFILASRRYPCTPGDLVPANIAAPSPGLLAVLKARLSALQEAAG
jgi:hypothetical protein